MTPMSGLPLGGTDNKRRASKACLQCRSRKVRCDVIENGVPCMNCRLERFEEVQCIVTERKRKRTRAVADTDGKLSHQPTCNSFEGANDLAETFNIDGHNEFEANQANDSGEDGLDHCVLCLKPSYQDGQKSPTAAMSIRLFSSPLQLPAGMTHFPCRTSRPIITFPPFIRPILRRVTTEDLEFLQNKGAFLIPDDELRNALLRCFVQFVHPFLPIIDLRAFLCTIQRHQTDDTVSLLLFQAVMCAAIPYIDGCYLITRGYLSRRAAHKSFFERVKLLYDFDVEVDRVAIVQTALLMTSYYEKPDDLKDVWHWLGVAVSIAQSIELNCDTLNTTPTNSKQRHPWKRVWWSCFIRDRLIALSMRRPMQIKRRDFDVSMLELFDFDIEPLPPELSPISGDCPGVQDAFQRVTLAQLYIELAKLCLCIGQVLDLQYSALGQKVGATTQETTRRLIPKKSAVTTSDITRCDVELDKWFEQLPGHLHYPTLNSSERGDGEAVDLHRALLRGVHLMTVSALHRPQVQISAPKSTITPELRKLSRRKLREGADDITEVYRNLQAQDLLRYLPNIGVTCLLSALVVHLFDLKSTNPATRDATRVKFWFCVQALQRLREMYASADSALFFLDAAVRQTKTEVSPAPVGGSVTKRTLRHDNDPPEPNIWQATLPFVTTPPGVPQLNDDGTVSAYPVSVAVVSTENIACPVNGRATAMLADTPEEREEEPGLEGLSGVEERTPNEFGALVDLVGAVDSSATLEDGLDWDMQWMAWPDSSSESQKADFTESSLNDQGGPEKS